MSNSWICVDASLVVRYLMDPEDDRIQRLWKKWDSEQCPLAAPTLVYYEVTNALYKYQKQGLSLSAVRIAQRAALALPLILYGEAGLHQRALEIAQRFSLPATYDAHYLALAEQLGADFWTADRRLARSVKDVFDWVYTVTD